MAQQLQNSGLARLTAELLTFPWWMQWGTGVGAAKTADTVTVVGTTEARVQAATVQGTMVAIDDTITFSATITALESVAISEVGIFDSAGTGSPPTGGIMDVYADFPLKNLNQGDSLNYAITLTFG
ncbi:hypothetical protein [Bradyrhizobium sp.]|uniref:hypothetical protein n=1 Tax=Bradyrhizobium sp. TaxID=376 RepID=UPI003C162836